MPSSQFLGLPPQFPPLQVSFTVHMLPSLQRPVALLRVHAPVAGSQASSVQALPSSQSTGAAPHSSVVASHASRVHGSPSSHVFEAPWHTTAPEVVETHTSS